MERVYRGGPPHLPHRSASAGRVKAVRIDVGDVVAAGELVAEMDLVDLNDRIAAAWAALERAGRRAYEEAGQGQEFG